MSELVNLIREKIAAHNNSLPFIDFMRAALYAKGLGYYVGGKPKLGAEGDFVTAPEISSLFSRALAIQCQQILQHLPGSDILEFGAGSGMMASDILLRLSELNCLPKHYYILEPSPDLQAYQYATLAKKVPHFLSKIEWLSKMPENFSGVILANEVLDAFPITLFKWSNHKFYERCVSYQDNKFVWQDLEVTDDKIFSQLPRENFSNDYISEINLSLHPWLATISQNIDKAIILIIDYGFPRLEYYHPQRHTGTLMCHYKHQAHTDPLINIGWQDITTHVDFTAVAEAAVASNLTVLGYTNQANFLFNCGILTDYETLLPLDELGKLQWQKQLQKLIEPHEMGELFKVMALGKGFEISLESFAVGNRLHTL